ncbi:uncharacterized protein BROUX77_007046 [Berkeleyomyces rouxiae]|uniref:uncharacterized protein n=1 Tax=Berkeleyomyces rouxiae TaxID=2035830 RepID=UPI003B7F3ECC
MSGRTIDDMRAAYASSPVPSVDSTEDKYAQRFAKLESKFAKMLAMLENQSEAAQQAAAQTQASQAALATATAAAAAAASATGNENGRAKLRYKIPSLSSTEPEEFDAWFDQVLEIWHCERGHVADRDFIVSIYAQAEGLARSRMRSIKTRLTDDGPVSCDRFLQELQGAFEDKVAVDKAQDQLSRLKQRGRRIEVHLPEFEDLLTRAKALDAADSQKIRWLKDSLDTPIREYVANSFPPRVFSEYLDRVVLAAEELRQRKLDAESTSGRRSGYYPSAPAAHRHPDAMDWERTRRVAPQPTRTPAARRTARWASEEERERRRRAGLCIRCGASGHFVRECPYDVPPNRNAPPARVRGVHVPTPPQLDDDLDADFGAARFELDLGGLREEVLALVVPDIYDDELLIGYPWLSHHNALIDCNRHRLVLPHFSVPRSVSTIRNLDTPTELKAARVSKILHQDLKVFAASIQDINKALEKLARENEPVTDDWKEKVPSWIDPQNVVAFDPEALYTRRLPPLRPGMNHEIHLTVPDSEAPWGPLYSLSHDELIVLRQTLLNLLNKKFIRMSSSTAAAPILFVKKPGGGLRFCVDYRLLNKLMKKDRYPLPNFKETLRQISRSKWFTKLDVVAAFHNIRIEPGHEWKTAFRTRLGSFEWNVMPFGLSNAPAQFQRFLNSVLQEYLDLFCSAYVDDILVYTDGSLDEHKEQVNHVLAKLVKAGLTVDIDKCEFGVQEVKYLGYIIKPGKATMDPAKVQAVKDWPVPSSKKELRGFLGFANFYRPFIKNFAEVAVPLTSLTGHLVPFVWSPECQAAFSSLKDLFCASPVLRLFDHSLPTTVEADSSGYSTGAVLLQQHPDGLFPCAYISQKLSPAESNYEIHDKEMLAIVRALKEWRGELRGAQGPIRVLTDHKNLLHFTSAQQLTERQARWANLLSEFDLTLEHRPGKLSPLPDALSRLHMPSGPDDPRLQARNQQLLQCLPDGALKVRPARVTLPSPFRKEALSTLWEQALSADSDYAAACAVVASQAPKWPDSLKTNWRVSLSECSLDSEGRLRYRSRLWVPQWEPLRTALLQEIHDSVTLVHPGQRIMCQEVSKTYFWPHYTADVKRFCRNCEICGSTNVMRQLKQGLLKPLPVPDRIWRDIGIDLIGPLPPCKKEGKVYKHVMTVVDHLSKGVILIACRSLDIEYLASRFLEVYYPRHGLPNSIASDRQFANMFWKRLCTTLKIDRRLSTAYHPQTNGATERTNAEVKTKMAKLLHDRSDWLDCLPIVEFALNAAPAASTETSPFTLSHGYSPDLVELQPDAIAPLAAPVAANTSPIAQATRILKSLADHTDWAKASLSAAKSAMEEQSNRHRQPHRRFQPGDWVWLAKSSHTVQQEGPGKRLRPRYQKLQVLEAVGSHSYRLDLKGARGHDVFHADRLKYHPNDPWPSQDPHVSSPGPVEIDGFEEYEVEKILEHRPATRDEPAQYLVKWVGWRDPTWEPTEALEETAALEEFLRAQETADVEV